MTAPRSTPKPAGGAETAIMSHRMKWTGRRVSAPGPGHHLIRGSDMAQRTCSIESCDLIARSRGWCVMHYTRWVRHGDPQPDRPPRPTGDDATRFWAYVDRSDNCWLWVGGHNGIGYGTYNATVAGQWRHVLAHRFAYELLVGPIPEGLELDHLCRVTNCVRPDHLEPVTHAENMARGFGPSAINARKTHCPQGHPYDEANTIRCRDGNRVCRTCKRDRRRLARTRAS